MIAAHGGQLVDRVVPEAELAAALDKAKSLPRLVINHDLARDAQNIARGVFSPLTGFIGKADFDAVLAGDRLVSGVAWTIPIMLDVPAANTVAPGGEICLYDETRPEIPLAIMEVHDVWAWDKAAACQQVFGTADAAHPGVAGFLARGDWLVGGPLSLLDNDRGPYAAFNLFPAETREVFAKRGWKTVVAFQTRNVPHAGHEVLQKTVLGLCDGLLIHPIIGKKKPGDFRDEVILEAYKVIIDEYFNPERVFLNILPTEMRYAGPKEAIMHAIMRKNYGCTHIIIGRDHAGVGKFYGEEEAIEFFSQFPDLEIQPIIIRGDFWYCKHCAQVASDRTCPHGAEEQIPFSGSLIRGGIIDGQAPPPEVMRPEVFAVIRSFAQPFVE
ncbi:MAG TPA: sulfate adenylyltransferase [Armatimonadota bacterium]|jgi:sulfate adenylyltransferase